MTTKWQGLWAQERQGYYSGQVIKKSEIPKYTRLILRYNKFYEKDSNRPRFVYCFADSEGYEEKCIHLELNEDSEEPYIGDDGHYYDSDDNRLYTRDEVRRIMDKAWYSAYYRQTSDPWDLLPEDYV